MTTRSSIHGVGFAQPYQQQQNNSQRGLSPDDLLTIKEVASIFRLDPTTIRRWIKIGKIPAVELPHSGTRTVYRVKRTTVETLLVERPILPFSTRE